MSRLPSISTTQPLGRAGIQVSSLAWGMWRFAKNDFKRACQIVNAVLESGIRLFDTADIYGFRQQGFGAAEELLGQVFRASPGLREQVVLATKGGICPPTPYDSSAPYLASAIDASLKRMGVERIDLWQIHRPDMLTHPHEIARAIEGAHQAGKIRAFGVSNFTPTQISSLSQFLPLPIATTQPELSPFCLTTFENGELDQALAMSMSVLAWSPLGGGRLFEPTTEREQAVASLLQQFAEQQNVSLSAAALAWMMVHPARPIPIIGSQNPDRIAETTLTYQCRWTRSDWYAVLTASRGKPLP